LARQQQHDLDWIVEHGAQEWKADLDAMATMFGRPFRTRLTKQQQGKLLEAYQTDPGVQQGGSPQTPAGQAAARALESVFAEDARVGARRRR